MQCSIACRADYPCSRPSVECSKPVLAYTFTLFHAEIDALQIHSIHLSVITVRSVLWKLICIIYIVYLYINRSGLFLRQFVCLSNMGADNSCDSGNLLLTLFKNLQIPIHFVSKKFLQLFLKLQDRSIPRVEIPNRLMLVPGVSHAITGEECSPCYAVIYSRLDTQSPATNCYTIRTHIPIEQSEEYIDELIPDDRQNTVTNQAIATKLQRLAFKLITTHFTTSRCFCSDNAGKPLIFDQWKYSVAPSKAVLKSSRATWKWIFGYATRIG